MRYFRLINLFCAATCAAWLAPQRSSAESAPLVLTPSVLGADAPARQPVAAPTAPPDDSSLLPATDLQATDGKSMERPIYDCACGCGIFEVGTGTMLPQGKGGMVYLEYDYQNQNINWSGVRPAPGSANDDKEIRTNFVTLGVQYFFNRSWGIQAELPYDNRSFKTTGGASGNDIVTLQWGALGDLRLQAIYAGFFEDQSLGVSFGVKAPTGNFKHNNQYGDADRDSELGTGCTDLLAGGFFRHQFTQSLTGFAQVLVDAPLNQVQGYRPGLEADGAVGVYFTGLKSGRVSITPIGQVLASERGHDSGINAAHPIASGYQRLLLSPGLEIDIHPVMLYADIEAPVWQHFSGDQLTAGILFKFIAAYRF